MEDAKEHDIVCPNCRPKYGMIRLCEGRSIMLTPRCSVEIDMDNAAKIIRPVTRFEDEFIKVEWCGTLVTLYQKGSMLFYHLDDRDVAERYATAILTTLHLVKPDHSQCIEVGVTE
jgi:hypothetical protein